VSDRRPLLEPADVARQPIRAEVYASGALFLGIGLLMLGNGLQGTLLGVRAEVERFPTGATGLVMSSYYLGFLGGSLLVPRALARVGHIRVFAALTSLASSVVLLHALFVHPASWMVMRLVSGTCMAGLFVVAESWLNDRATNTTRGALLSIYMVVQMGAMGAGQFLLTAGEPASFELFVLVSVLVSLAAVPIALSVKPGPRFHELAHVSVAKVFRAAPLGIVGTVGVGLSHGAIFGMGAVYARSLGLSIPQISVFMAATIFGGVVLQAPIGHVSDRTDRRRVIVLVGLAAAGLAVVGAQAAAPGVGLLVLMAALGGMTIPLYSLCIAHANDYLAPSEMVAASGSLILANGVGAVLGPFGASMAMSLLGPGGFFWTLAAVHALVACYALYRITRRAPAGDDTRSEWAPLAPRSSPVVAALTEDPDPVEDWETSELDDLALDGDRR
jgi:MFS family permease